MQLFSSYTFVFSTNANNKRKQAIMMCKGKWKKTCPKCSISISKYKVVYCKDKLLIFGLRKGNNDNELPIVNEFILA
ncbi:hypothetical protein T10_6450 [Trichinella papuae]|uniref:Uncharacterized protein n=1 Tax=Trichinella papuae TaxID=268474 RepID=A0A0V1MQI9_9BILA|nr:hypothetical protein T10_6450 [Trichinella papuae]